MAEVYEKRKDEDGFLYILYTDETTLGWIDWIETLSYFNKFNKKICVNFKIINLKSKLF